MLWDLGLGWREMENMTLVREKVNLTFFFKISLLLISKQTKVWVICHELSQFFEIMENINPIPAGGGVKLTPTCSFLHNSKSIGLRLLNFSDFSYIPKALPLGLKPGFNTNCLSPQAHCLKDCFFL